MLTIVKYPAAVLTRPARRIKPGDTDLHALFAEMVETMDANHGVGLAAPQVDLGIRFIVAHDIAGQRTLGLANPQITEYSAVTEVGNEGCLSFPDLYGDVERAVSIVVRWQDLDFKHHEERFSGHFARVLQHEIDHINGILLLHRAIDGLHRWTEEDERKAAAESAAEGEADDSEAAEEPVGAGGEPREE